MTNIETSIDEIIEFLNEFKWIYDFKWLDIFSEQHYENLPADWCDALSELTLDQLRNLTDNQTLPRTLQCFLMKCLKFSLNKKWPKFKLTDLENKSTQISIKLKKQQEIEHFRQLILDTIDENCKLISSTYDQFTIIDIGAGLGYIEEKLINDGFNLIGIEFQESSCNKANEKFHSYKTKKSNINFIQMNVNLTEICFSQLKQLINTELENNKEIIIIGLHTCGDLFNTILEIFNYFSDIKLALCLPCCYHRIDHNNLPRSKLLTKHLNEKFAFNIFTLHSLRLACQETPLKWFHEMNDEKLAHHAHQGLLRAVLNEMLVKNSLSWKKPKRRVKCTNSLDEYIQSISTGFQENDREIAASLMRSFYENRLSSLQIINIFKVLQIYLQPVIESLILVDHQMKLKEFGYQVNIVSCFDEIISPRNNCLIAIKQKN